MKKRNHRPPFILRQIISYFTRFSDELNLLGDLDEEYADLINLKGKLFAYKWYWRNFIKTIPSLLIESITWSFAMFNNYLKIAFRNILKNKSISAINIFGLTLGLTCSILIFLWVQDQLSYNQWQKNKDDIYRLEMDTWVVMPPITAEIPKTFPEVKEVTRFYFWWEPTLSADENVFSITDLALCDSNVFKVFNFDFIYGDPDRAFDEPYTIVLTESISTRLFGNSNPVGKKLQVNSTHDYSVSAVVRDIKKLHMNINAFISVHDIVRIDGDDEFLTARSHNFDIYVLTNSSIDIKNLAEKINERGAAEFDYPGKDFLLRPFNEIYFAQNLPHENNTLHGNMNLIIVFSVIAVLILLIACINFVNLTVAKTSTREKEIAVRKVVGARQSSLQKQFFGETLLIVLISFMLAMISVKIFLPQFSNLTGEEIYFSDIGPGFMLVFLAIILFTAFVSGLYPSFYLSVLKPVMILKGKSGGTAKGSSFSKMLISFQFAISIFLLITTLTVIQQLKYMQTKDLGIDHEQMLVTTVRGSNFRGDIDQKMANKKLFKEKLLQSPEITAMTYIAQLPGKITNTWGWYIDNPDETTPLKVIDASPDLFDTFGMELIKGRTHSFNNPTDFQRPEQINKFVINESAAKALGLEDPMSRLINNNRIEIIGIIKDFHFNSLHTKIEPLAIRWAHWASKACIKIRGNDVKSAINYIEQVYREFCPGVGFEYTFLDESFAKQYEAEKKLELLLTYFVSLAVTLSCLGLFALTAFMAERRIKEIGIRKVLGSSNSGIVIILSQSFVRWIVIANLVAWPVAYFVLEKWLQNFAYHIETNLITFLGGSLLAILVASLTITYQALRAASKNPAETLKAE